MPTPNLFDYATKELSQDAMICWLIAWSQTKPRNESERKLRDLGREFVTALLAKCKIDLVGDIRALEIHQQERGIDVLVRFRDEKTTHVLLIEDKKNAHEHGNQLERYYKILINGKSKLERVSKRQIRAIYLKTGNQSYQKDKLILKKKFKLFNRHDFLKVLKPFPGRHPIVVDFRDHLQRKEHEYNSFEQWTCNDRHKWKWAAWERFYRCLEDKVRCVDWGYVNAPGGGFPGFWWHSKAVEDGNGKDIYLQIKPIPIEVRPEDRRRRPKLCFKVNAGSKDKREQIRTRNMYRDKIIAAGKGLVEVPERMGRGKTMTVAHWKDEWLEFNDGGLLDIDATVKNLKKAQRIVTAAAKDAGHNLRQGGSQNPRQGATTS